VNSRTPSPQAPRRRPSRWSQFLLYSLGVFLFGLGVGALVFNHLVEGTNSQITGQTLPELEPADRIVAAPGSLAGWNVLFVTLDTTRADHLGSYGNRSIETPNLDRLAREGVLFANALTTVPATLPGHSSLLTGLYPFNHGARANGTFRLEDDQITLAERLQKRGFRTAAAISAYVLDSTYGLSQGFEQYYDDLTRGNKYAPQMFRERAAELTNEVVFEWLGEHADEQFFLWVHYFDAHEPHVPPEPFRSDYAADLYDGEIAYADAQFGNLLGRLSELGVRERTLVVVTADHGEGLGEHGEQTHSLFIYDGTLHVPLIVHAPAALPKGRVVERQVSLVDVVPTVLELLGMELPRGLDGISLLQAPADSPRAHYVETLSTMTLHGWAPLLGVRREDYKYILAPRPELYDLRSDPSELENLYQEREEVAAEFDGILQELVGGDPLLAAQVSPNLEANEEALRKLAALGYITTRVEGDTDAVSLIDPKDGIHHWEGVQKGVHLRNQGDIAGAIEILEAAVEEVPTDIYAMTNLASSYQLRGMYQEALDILDIVETLAPSDTTPAMAAAGALLRLGEIDRAEAKLHQVLERKPDHPPVHMQLSQIARRRGDRGAELRLLQKALSLDRGTYRASILNQLASHHRDAGSSEEAQAHYHQALEVDAFNGEAHAGLAEILWSEGSETEAVQHLEQALRFNPAQPRALAVSCGVMNEQGEFDAAIRTCERSLEIMPVFGPAHANLGLAYRRKGDLEKAEEIYRAGIEKVQKYDALHQNLAQLLLKQGRTDEAVEEFKAAVESNPRNAVALANLGIHNLQAGRDAVAQAFFQRAIRAKPGYAFAHKQLGVLLLANNRIEPALFHLERSLELDPQQPDAGRMRFELESRKAAQGETVRGASDGETSGG